MKLYVYDHCPFCVRAKMIFGLKDLPVEILTIANDDEKTPISLVGKKVVPILVKEDGTAMPESLDIVRYIDTNYGSPIIAETIRPEIEQWVSELGKIYNHLLLPRFVKLDLDEFKQPSAIDYFVEKKTEYIGNFDQNLAKSAKYIQAIEPILAKLSGLIKSDTALNGQLSVEDIIVFPMLRNLTCVKDIEFPAEVLNYLMKMSELSKVNLYFTQAI
ncbi:glutaredoxin 2 [Mannheimia sp. AT1]|uniref:Glutaredoxin 2 n=1 Tax=Mannheimia cairinae TaxID=3025936 RepID=A0ABT5MNV5_9PAST|nr:glutaredoxin 2 [Mannheimia cairinae]MDD0823682.1 glutaredoxin 2 [Mannheimia cairinae]MDD0825386.1 glutaredoxin 2 [Mannheimia cairinae]